MVLRRVWILKKISELFYSKLFKENSGDVISEVLIRVSRKENFGITVFVEDKETAASRTILSNFQGMYSLR